MSLVGVAEVVGAVLERLRTEVANLEEIYKTHQRFFFFPPLEMQSNIFILYAGFQQRQGQKEHLLTSYSLHTAEERRGRRGKKYPVVNLGNCTGKIER